MMVRISLFFIVFIGALSSISHAIEITREKAIALVTERLEKLERYVFLYSISRDDSVLSEMKKLALSGRDTIHLTTHANLTRKVHNEFYWFNNSRYPRHAPHHALGFSDGKTSYYWLSDGNSSNTSSPPSYTHIQAAPSINLFIDEWLIYPLPHFCHTF